MWRICNGKTNPVIAPIHEGAQYEGGVQLGADVCTELVPPIAMVGSLSFAVVAMKDPRHSALTLLVAGNFADAAVTVSGIPTNFGDR
jgi:hypothetical protein